MINNKIIFVFLFSLLFGSMNAYSYVSFTTPSDEVLDVNGFITFEHDSTEPLTCILEIQNLNENLNYSNTISVDSTPYSFYYYGVGYGYVDFSLECGDGVDLYSDTQQYFIPVRKDALPYLITFILMLIAPLLMKPLGLLKRVTNNNVYFEFVLFALIVIMIIMFGNTTSAFYNVYLHMIGLSFALFGLAMSFWFIIVDTITNFNRGVKN